MRPCLGGTCTRSTRCPDAEWRRHLRCPSRAAPAGTARQRRGRRARGDVKTSARLPDRDRAWRAISPQKFVFRHELTTGLQCRRVDQPVCRIARERRWQGCRGQSDRRRDWHGPNLRRELPQPGSDRKRHRNALVGREPCELPPADVRDEQLVSARYRLGRCATDPPGVDGPPVEDVAIEDDGAQRSTSRPCCTGPRPSRWSSRCP